MSNTYVNKVELADGTSLIDISDSTVTASDVLNSKYFYDATGQKKQGTAIGGATNFVTGKFTPSASEKGSTKTISIPYTGTGYPISIMIYPSEGSFNPNGTFYSTIAYRAVILYMAVKNIFTLAPLYTRTAPNDTAMVLNIVKNSTTDPTVTTASSTKSFNLYGTNGATAYSNEMVRVNSKTQLSVMVSNNAYGFAAGVEYTYQIVYSS